MAQPRDMLPAAGTLPGDLVMEQKVDGFRAIAFVRQGSLYLQSRRGGDLRPAFPDIALAAAELDDVVLDELVVPVGGRLDFSALQSRARRRGRGAVVAAAEHPAHLIVFDVLEAGGVSLIRQPYSDRRARLEQFFARGVLAAPFALCPATSDEAQAREWLAPDWGEVGVEGCVVKGSRQPYRPGKREWIKVRSRQTHEAVVGAVTGTLRRPSSALLGRYDRSGQLRLVGRSVPLAHPLRATLAERVSPASDGHPWAGWTFSAGWSGEGKLEAVLVAPDVVAEFSGDTAVDHGRWRHPVRLLRLREDRKADDVPSFESMSPRH
ncbi:ATP-dependent DNA ligase [Streptomyces alboflavus]